MKRWLTFFMFLSTPVFADVPPPPLTMSKRWYVTYSYTKDTCRLGAHETDGANGAKEVPVPKGVCELVEFFIGRLQEYRNALDDAKVELGYTKQTNEYLRELCGPKCDRVH